MRWGQRSRQWERENLKLRIVNFATTQTRTCPVAIAIRTDDDPAGQYVASTIMIPPLEHKAGLFATLVSCPEDWAYASAHWEGDAGPPLAHAFMNAFSKEVTTALLRPKTHLLTPWCLSATRHNPIPSSSVSADGDLTHDHQSGIDPPGFCSAIQSVSRRSCRRPPPVLR